MIRRGHGRPLIRGGTGSGRGVRSAGKERYSAGVYDQNIPGSARITRWSYYHQGDVEVPEICVYSIENRCQYEKSGCLRLHAKCTSQWQLYHMGHWYNLRNFHSIEVEEAYQDVEKDTVSLSTMDSTLLGKASQDMFKLLGKDKWILDFDSMYLKRVDGLRNFRIRRLSTQSSAKSNSAKATTYHWFFKGQSGKWVKYGEADLEASLVPNITCQDIEAKYVAKKVSEITFSNNSFRYKLHFDAMTQANLDTGKVRPVRRRPMKRSSTKPAGGKELPATWDKMEENETMVRVKLNASTEEYLDVVTRISLTIPGAKIKSIERVQSPYLWRAFKNKEKQLAISHGGDDNLNVQKLFHGTSAKHVDTICRENFDWRLCGTNVGKLYGEGSYFSNNAAVALTYSKADKNGDLPLLLADVIVGQVTVGTSVMKRPPKDPSTGRLFDTTVDNVSSPKVFVKYDQQEYCPLYVITM